MTLRRKNKKVCTWACRCRVKYSVLAKDPDLHLLQSRIKCWATYGCRYYLTRDDSLSAGQIVRAIDIYKIMAGLGNETERRCSPTTMRQAMLGKRIVAVALEPAPDQKRSMITSLTLEDGNTVHLAPSTKGVTIYKVTHEQV